MQRNVRGVLKLCRVSISRKGNLIMQMTTGIQREKNIRAEYTSFNEYRVRCLYSKSKKDLVFLRMVGSDWDRLGDLFTAKWSNSLQYFVRFKYANALSYCI